MAQTNAGEWELAEESLTRALALRREHDSPHAIAETLVALARLRDAAGNYPQAAEHLIEAAEMVFSLGAEPSLSVIRRGLARVYRHLGRHADALAVLDDAPEAHSERAAILRAQGQYDEAAHEIMLAPDAPPEARAEILLLAGRGQDALDAIAGQNDPASALLRAQVHHVQGNIAQAIESYHLALEAAKDALHAPKQRGLGAALALDGRVEEAQIALASARLQRDDSPPDPERMAHACCWLPSACCRRRRVRRRNRPRSADRLQPAQSGDAADAAARWGALWSLRTTPAPKHSRVRSSAQACLPR